MPGGSLSDTSSSSRRPLRGSQVFGVFDSFVAQPVGSDGAVTAVNHAGVAVSSMAGPSSSFGRGPSKFAQPIIKEPPLIQEAAPIGLVGSKSGPSRSDPPGFKQVDPSKWLDRPFFFSAGLSFNPSPVLTPESVQHQISPSHAVLGTLAPSEFSPVPIGSLGDPSIPRLPSAPSLGDVNLVEVPLGKTMVWDLSRFFGLTPLLVICCFLVAGVFGVALVLNGSTSQGNADGPLQQLHASRLGLLCWSKHTYGSIDKRIKQLEDQLAGISNLVLTSGTKQIQSAL
ncbi:hypothetical protein Salat_2111000 [Sesamum alatum]|uniref:Uncharacterized protein n=1 Tax=Sesamum alatum TaxID=300844 RepID=A0AAE1Y1Q0_9LAMI|nr:hypothetical protein Salat_2111000 [Sesamum alatum]